MRQERGKGDSIKRRKWRRERGAEGRNGIVETPGNRARSEPVQALRLVTLSQTLHQRVGGDEGTRI